MYSTKCQPLTKRKQTTDIRRLSNCLGDLTRTSDLLVPNQVRYQLRHTQMPLERDCKDSNFFRKEISSCKKS